MELGPAEAAANVDDLVDVATPRLGGKVRPEHTVDVAKQSGDLIEVARPGVTQAQVRNPTSNIVEWAAGLGRTVVPRVADF